MEKTMEQYQNQQGKQRNKLFFGREVLTRTEWIISHGFLFAGLISTSIAISLVSNPPASTLFIFGLWFSFGGICYVVSYIIEKNNRK
jgi:hypothetical protein